MIAIFVDFVLDIDDNPCKNGFPGRYVKFQEFLESKLGGIGLLKLLFQTNNSDRDGKSANQFGIIPDSELFCKNKYCKLAKWFKKGREPFKSL
jgi:hypothetical protein